MAESQIDDVLGNEFRRAVRTTWRTRKTDVDSRGICAMRTVVDRVLAERRDDLEPAQGRAGRRLVPIGHDPLMSP
ncbi:hypothetical protein H4W33_000695 [Kibdelosporangium phytohabitans]|nr:hypothetical protein [Kibdelosporangium phytohabitans]MBE1461683.1 hypothetical protein [Kibdelosporangium phytohabitans]